MNRTAIGVAALSMLLLAPAAAEMNNIDIFRMTREKASPEAVIAKIRSCRASTSCFCDFVLQPANVEMLTREGVPPEVIQAMKDAPPGPSAKLAGAKSDSNGQTNPQYSTSQRIQISESCPSVAKWLTQGLIAGPHWQMLRYEPELGILTFKVISMDSLTKDEIRQYLADDSKKAKNVHVDELVFTLRSLVTSTLSFDNTQHSTVDSCTIASAFKFVSKDRGALLSSGKMETELLQTLKNRHAEHGLDY